MHVHPMAAAADAAAAEAADIVAISFFHVSKTVLRLDISVILLSFLTVGAVGNQEVQTINAAV